MLRAALLICCVPPSLADVSIAAGGHVTCVLAQGSVRCWGLGITGQLGAPPVGFGTDLAVQQIAVGKEQVCARLSDDSVACAVAKAGDLVPVELRLQGIKEVVAGGMQSCARLMDGALKCWGQDLFEIANVRDDSGEMGESLRSVELGQPVVQVAAGSSHACALLQDGAVKCWGDGALGHRGRGSTSQANLPAIDLGADAVAAEVVAGGGFSCARLLAGNLVKCWGSGTENPLGLALASYVGHGAREIGEALPALDLRLGRSALALTAGEDHACARLDDNTVKCWGSNDYGQLGQGHTRPIGRRPGDMGENLPPVDLGRNRTALAVAAGAFHSCAILDDYSVKCWGFGAYGQLGNGGTASLGDEPGEMGDELPVSLVLSDATSTAAPATLRFLQPSGACCGNSSDTTQSPCEILQAYIESVFPTSTTTYLNVTFQTARMSSEEKRTITFASMGVVSTALLCLILFIVIKHMEKRRLLREKLAQEAAIKEMLSDDDDIKASSARASARALAAVRAPEAAPASPVLEQTLRPEQLQEVRPSSEPHRLPAPQAATLASTLSPTPSETPSVRSGPVPPPAKASVPSPRPPPARSPRPAPPKPPEIKLPNYMSEEAGH